MAAGDKELQISGLGAGTMQFISPLVVKNASGNALFSVGGIETGLTAAAGGTQAGALALDGSKTVHVVTVVATDADSVKLPLALGQGAVHYIHNADAGQDIQVFGSGTDTINGVATATGVAIGEGKGGTFVDYAAGKWFMLLGA
jgi:hypothetical protein